ncbi:MAG: bifunctional tetrahydrofolate synthase/dihydrofolate synthase [Gammaproteobacteria bacterium]|nr:bifunctional tetrahydrofolate synthase/dihydrofolate synthase [Gammaproteobacteria bacterium]
MFKTLNEWLDWQETLHPSEIDLGLERVEKVLHRLIPECISASRQFVSPYTIVTVAGTNGKGSSVAMLESILVEAGYKVGSYTSPHLLKYNERIKVNQIPVTDEFICDSFERINTSRGELSLTYFEFATLAAIDIFYYQSCEIVILEVGLGGRLDAVNVVDADVALVTTVDIDHQEWLGSDRDSIGIEKAGIFRQNKPAIYGDSDMPQSIQRIVDQKQLSLYQYSVDYHSESRSQQWDWLISTAKQIKNNGNKLTLSCRYNLPMPNLSGTAQLKNASNVLMVLELLRKTFPVTQAEIKRGLQNIQLPGRFQIVSTEPLVILDVAHNVQAVQVLNDSIKSLNQSSSGKIHVIVGMLRDKEVLDVLSVLAPIVHSWRVIDLNSPRAMPAEDIKALLINNKLLSNGEDKKIQCFSNFEQAYKNFCTDNLMLNSIDTLLVFGSFFTVTDALHFFQSSDKMMTHE